MLSAAARLRGTRAEFTSAFVTYDRTMYNCINFQLRFYIARVLIVDLLTYL